MAEFVTINLGDHCAETTVQPEDDEPQYGLCRSYCRGATAAGLCFIVLTISGIISVPFLVAPLGQDQTNVIVNVTNSSSTFRPQLVDLFPTSSTQSILPATSYISPHDVMQADNGFLATDRLAENVDLHKPREDIQFPDLLSMPSALDSSKLQSPDLSETPEHRRNLPSARSIKILCDPTTKDNLKLMLGPAFNPRYMSLKRPPAGEVASVSLGAPVEGFQSDESGNKIRHHDNFKHREFVVDGNFARDVQRESVYDSMDMWEKQQQKLTQKESAPKPTKSAEKFLRRIRRFSGFLGTGLSASSHKLKTPTTEPPKYPWQCKSKVVWEDLGDDHFPRFLRTVQCLGDKCWFNHFQCKAKAFTVKILRRKSDQCVPVPNLGSGPTQYEQEWVYEERAVTFCCECVES